MPEAAPSSQIRFADFELDLTTGELARGGEKLHLHEKPFQVLMALVETPGELVTRQELQSRLWSDDTFVDFDNNLNAAVKRLRDTLGDAAGRPRFIETLPRKGYRFIGAVETCPRAIDTEPARTAVAAPRRAPFLWLLVPALVALTAGAVVMSRSEAPVPKVMLAVLPFENLDGDTSHDFFADGLTEEMITQLGRLQPERLGVIARTSAMAYKGTDKTVDQIGRELAVDYVLEGSVRGAQDRLRVTAQLIEVAGQTHLWAETYDRGAGDVLDIQSEISVKIAGSLALELLPGQARAHARAATANTEAYQEYLRGRGEWSRFRYDGYELARAHFERALELDPAFRHAWAGLADAYNLLGFNGMPRTEAFPEALAAAARALELDPDLAAAHNSRGFALLYYEWDFDGAERAFERALELDPNFAMAHHWATGLYSALGRHDEAITACKKAMELDPVSLSVSSDLGLYLIYAGRYDEAITECERTLAIQPGYGTALHCLKEAYLQKGMIAEVLELLKENGMGDEIAALSPRGDPAVTLRRLRESWLAQALDREGAWAMGLAGSYARLGRTDEAFVQLERAFEERDGWLVFLRVLPEMKSLRDDPRFDELAHRIGLPKPY